MKTSEQIAAETAGTHFDTYQDSAEEVGHPEGQPIVETWPALRACIAAAIEADRAQRAYIAEVQYVDEEEEDRPGLEPFEVEFSPRHGQSFVEAIADTGDVQFNWVLLTVREVIA